MTKVMRYELSWIAPEKSDVDYKKICEILWRLSDEVRTVSNRTVQLWWQWDEKRRAYHREHGEYPKFKDIYGAAPATQMYRDTKDEFVLISTDTLASLTRDVFGRMEKMRKEIWTGERSIVSYRRDQPILIVGRNIHLDKTKYGTYQIRLTMLSKQGMKHFNVDGKIFLFSIVGKLSGSSKAILERCFTGEYKIGASKLIYDKQKKKWFINLTYSFEAQNKNNLDPNRILGVDLGIVHAVHMAVSDVDWDGRRFVIEGGEITKFRTQIEYRRRSLQSQIRTAGNGRKGHGRKRALLPIEHLSHKAANFRDTTNFRYAKRIVDVALEYQCSMIQMEDLQGAGKNDSFLQQNWTFYDLQTKIENRAVQFGVAVKRVAPQYTSQRCHKCGFIDPDNRPAQAEFCCRQCGWKGNADFNAAKNLATRDIEMIIKDTIKASGAKCKRTQKTR